MFICAFNSIIKGFLVYLWWSDSDGSNWSTRKYWKTHCVILLMDWVLYNIIQDEKKNEISSYLNVNSRFCFRNSFNTWNHVIIVANE